VKKLNIKHWTPITIIVILIGVSCYFHLYQYLELNSLKAHRDLLASWQKQDFALFSFAFIMSYAAALLCAIPGSLFTIFGGFLFGTWQGSLYSALGATLGSFAIFLAVRYALRDWAHQKAQSWVERLRHGVEKNAFSYILAVRLVPIVPFFVVNIAAGLLDISASTFVCATAIGIIPETVIYSSLGHSLNHLLATNANTTMNTVLSPEMLLPLITLGCLALLPVVYSYYKRRKAKKDFHLNQPQRQEDSSC